MMFDELLAKAIAEAIASKPELLRALTPATTTTPQANLLDLFKGRLQKLEEVLNRRTALKDGRRGFRLVGEQTATIVLGPSLNDQDAPRETITLKTTETEVALDEPVLTQDGSTRLMFEILSLRLQGKSALFGGDSKVTMTSGRGADKFMRPTFGRLDIPLSLEFGQVPLRSVQEVYFTIETPKGTLHNREPARMVGHITNIPPVGVAYVQEFPVVLFNEAGEKVAVKAAGSQSRIVGVLE